eukprot:249469_1
MYSIFDFKFCEKAIGIHPLTHAQIRKMDSSDWILLNSDELTKQITEKYDKQIQNMEDKISQFKNQMNANNWKQVNKTDQCIISSQCKMYARKLETIKKEKDERIRESKQRQFRKFKQEVAHDLNKLHCGNPEGAFGKVANKELMKFIMDFESGKYSNWGTHPRRHEMTVLLELEQKKDGKLMYAHYYLYALIFIAAGEQIVLEKDRHIVNNVVSSFIKNIDSNMKERISIYNRQFSMLILHYFQPTDMNTVKNEEVKQYLSKRPDNVELFMNAAFNS